MGVGGGRRGVWKMPGVEAPERAFTDWLGTLHSARRGVQVGIGDDAAVLDGSHLPLVVACDPVLEGVHFDERATPQQITHKAVHRNLSDLAAMGAEPRYLLVSMLLPTGTSARAREALSRGLERAASKAGCSVVGGDVATTTGPLTLTVTAIGQLPPRVARAGSVGQVLFPAPLTRDAARVGDRVHVSGALGGSLLGRHLTFRARIEEGLWLNGCEDVGGVLDVSDGLAIDLATICQASGVPGAVLFEEAIPVHRDAVRRSRSGSGRSALAHALGDGEDHELLFTVRPQAALPWDDGVMDAVARVPIGELRERPGLWLRDRAGRERRLDADSGFQHALGS